MRPSALATAASTREALFARSPVAALTLASSNASAASASARAESARRIVHRGLGALDLERVEDGGELRDLVVVEVELVRQEAQGPPHAEATAAHVVASTGSAVPTVAMTTEAPTLTAEAATTVRTAAHTFATGAS